MGLLVEFGFGVSTLIDAGFTYLCFDLGLICIACWVHIWDMGCWVNCWLVGCVLVFKFAGWTVVCFNLWFWVTGPF